LILPTLAMIVWETGSSLPCGIVSFKRGLVGRKMLR